jgi:hypothetical protein
MAVDDYKQRKSLVIRVGRPVNAKEFATTDLFWPAIVRSSSFRLTTTNYTLAVLGFPPFAVCEIMFEILFDLYLLAL